ncbi:MAG: fatty acid desaturase [Gammaproteobacteria bacterium HGW-Gammaproteobacteria-11]|nr:MAG: fatty acid desaturase [Gammaproteobacteria bacterium HGW-Gammaproteobacteria-11]
MQSYSSLWRENGMWPNTLAIAYVLIGYFGGWALMLLGNVWSLVLGVLAAAHAMTIAAYLIHECGHNALFKKVEHNTWLGRWMNVLTGSHYGTYEDMRYKHMRHHVDNCEPVTFDYRAFLTARPRLHKLVRALEWCYIPAVELLMHAMLIAAPFIYPARRAQRGRVIRVTLLRFTLFAVIAWFAPLAAVGYVLAYLLFLTFLRFMDSFQHNYEIVYTLDSPEIKPVHKGDRQYEESNTYSNLLSARWPWVNLLALNFSYHNAHHTKPNMPWFRLPAFHRELYGDDCPQQLDVIGQLRCFHRHRVERVLAEEYGTADVRSTVREGQAVGVNALSFLTAF